MRIIPCNANGLRSAYAKSFSAWLARQRPHVACMQEIKARESDLPPEVAAPRGLHAFFHPAQRNGYSGVAIYAFTWWVRRANARERNIGWRIDYEVGTPGIAKTARKASIYTKEVFSDHAPVVVDYDYEL